MEKTNLLGLGWTDDLDWRAEAMRAQLAQAEVGAPVPPLRARPGPFPFAACTACGRAMRLYAEGPGERLACTACGGAVVALCDSCGGATERGGGRCDACFAAACRVVPTAMLAKPTQGRVTEDTLRRLQLGMKRG